MVSARPSQRDLFTKRYRRVAAPEPSELQLQISLIKHCRWRLRDDVLFLHVPNGEPRDKRTGAKLKAMGVLPGVADLLFIWNVDILGTRVLFLELKRKSGRSTPAQCEFATRANRAGAFYRTAYSIDDALAVLDSFSLFRTRRK